MVRDSMFRPPLPAAGWLAIVLWTWPRPANAGNSGHAPTPVIFRDPPCLVVLRRPSEASTHVEYAIPYEDTRLTMDEVEDSRRHQFVATAAVLDDPNAVMPRFLDREDVRAAAERGLIDEATIGAEDVLDEHPLFAGRWLPITADAQRRPITCAAAEQGQDWDASEVPIGVYTVWGYTWEPPRNAWIRRGGAVKVVDEDTLPEDDPPGLALQIGRTLVYDDQPFAIRACVDAAAGTTITLEWSRSDSSPPQWAALVVDAPIGADELLTPAVPPELADGFASVAVRGTIRDPLGRTFVGYADTFVVKIDGSAPDTDGDDCSTSAEACGDDPCVPGSGDTGGDASDTGAGTAADGTTGSPSGGDSDGTSACGCRGTPFPAHALAAWCLVALGRRRSRP